MAAFVMVSGCNKRLRSIDGEGKEEYEDIDRWAPVRAVEEVHQLERQQVQKQKTEAGEVSKQQKTEEDEKEGDKPDAPQPHKAVERLLLALSELEAMIEVITRIQKGEDMCLEYIDRTKSGEGRMLELVVEKAPKIIHHQSKLISVSGRLRRGKELIEKQQHREKKFYSELTALQRFWQIRRRPPAHPYKFYADLSNLRTQIEQQEGLQTVQRAQAEVDIGADSQGNIKVTIEYMLEGGEVQRDVGIGSQQVHQLLLKRAQQILESDLTLVLLQQSDTPAFAQLAQKLHGAFSCPVDNPLGSIQMMLMNMFLTVFNHNDKSMLQRALLQILSHRACWQRVQDIVQQNVGCKSDCSSTVICSNNALCEGLRIKIGEHEFNLIVDGTKVQLSSAWHRSKGALYMELKPAEISQILNRIFDRDQQLIGD